MNLKESLKLIFHYKGVHVGYANEINTQNMKCTWPMRAPTQGDPTRNIFHWLALGPCMGVRGGSLRVCVGSVMLWLNFEYQHVGNFNVKKSCWGSKPMRWPNASGLTLQWNVGICCMLLSLKIQYVAICRFEKMC